MIANTYSTYAPAGKDAYPFSRNATPHIPARSLVRVYQHEVDFEDFRDVAVIALQDILSLLRVAKWRDEYHRGYTTDWPERLPHFSHSLSDQLHTSLIALVDATFDAPEHHTLRSLAHSTVNWLLAPTLPPTVSAVVWALDDAARLCAKGFAAFHASSAAPFVAPSFSLADTPLHTPPGGVAPSLALELVDAALRDNEAPRSGALRFVGRPAPAAAYFTFSLGPHPGRLLVSWPAEFGESFYDATKAVSGTLKEQERTPSYVDFVAFHMGSHLPGTREMSFPTSGADIAEWI